MDGSPAEPPHRKAAISFTGGKDSMTVLHLMRAPEVAVAASGTWAEETWRADLRQRLDQIAGCEAALLVTFVPAGAQQSFKAHPLEVVKLQAQALGLPHIVMEVSASPTFLDSYRDNIRKLREEHRVQVLATGDMLDVCSSFMPRAAEGTGVQLLSPLWEVNRRLLLELIWAYDMAPVITCVNVTKFGEEGCTAKAHAGPQRALPSQQEQKQPHQEQGQPQQEQGQGAQEQEQGVREQAPKHGLAANGAGEGPGEGAVCGLRPTPKTNGSTATTGAGDGAKMGGDGAGSEARDAQSIGGIGGAGPDGAGLDSGRALLGRELDRELHREALLPAVQAYGVDECGEWGEYHTMVTRSVLFAAPLRLVFGEVRQEGDYAFVAVKEAGLGLDAGPGLVGEGRTAS